MTTNEPGDPRHDSVVRLLDDPALWAEVPSGLRDRVLAEALGDTGTSSDTAADDEVGPAGIDDDRDAGAGAVPLHTARRRRTARLSRRPLLLAAAVVVVAGLGVIGGVRLAQDDGPEPLLEVALAGTEEAPGASATARLTQEPAGVSVTLDVSDLAPAPEGTFYEVWLVGDRGKVSAGTFHMRGDQDDIKLWWGVEPDGYDAVTVTRQPVDGGTTAEGVVVLRGELPTG